MVLSIHRLIRRVIDAYVLTNSRDNFSRGESKIEGVALTAAG